MLLQTLRELLLGGLRALREFLGRLRVRCKCLAFMSALRQPRRAANFERIGLSAAGLQNIAQTTLSSYAAAKFYFKPAEYGVWLDACLQKRRKWLRVAPKHSASLGYSRASRVLGRLIHVPRIAHDLARPCTRAAAHRSRRGAMIARCA